MILKYRLALWVQEVLGDILGGMSSLNIKKLNGNIYVKLLGILPTAPSSEKSPDVGFELRSDGTLILTIELFAFQSKERYEYIYDDINDW